MNIHAARGTLNEMLIAHEALLRERKEELLRLPEGKLCMRPGRKNGQVYYYRTLDGKRKSLTDDMEMARLLARKRFIGASLPEIEKNINGLKHLLRSYADVSEQSIISTLPLEYAWLMDDTEAAWNERKRRWMAEPFDQSTYKTWEKEHVTAKGLRVRSKSEVIIAERLDYYEILYHYEQILYIRQYDFAPDFTILTRKGPVWWEHCGKVNDPAYIRKHNWKLSMYEKAGIVPWKNLIVTYDDENGNFDSRIVEAEITNKILPHC